MKYISTKDKTLEIYFYKRQNPLSKKKSIYTTFNSLMVDPPLYQNPKSNNDALCNDRENPLFMTRNQNEWWSTNLLQKTKPSVQEEKYLQFSYGTFMVDPPLYQNLKSNNDALCNDRENPPFYDEEPE